MKRLVRSHRIRFPNFDSSRVRLYRRVGGGCPPGPPAGGHQHQTQVITFGGFTSGKLADFHTNCRFRKLFETNKGQIINGSLKFFKDPDSPSVSLPLLPFSQWSRSLSLSSVLLWTYKDVIQYIILTTIDSLSVSLSLSLSFVLLLSYMIFNIILPLLISEGKQGEYRLSKKSCSFLYS